MTAPTRMTLDFENGGKESSVGEGLDKELVCPPTRLVLRCRVPEMEPDKFNAVSAAILAGDEPEEFSIDGPPDGSVKLIAGYIDPSGNRHLTGEVRELRGRDEEEMARAFVTGDMSRYIDTILKAGVTRLGDTTDPKELQQALDGLLIGDRDVLVLQIRRLAYGDTMRLEVTCPFCQHGFDVDYSFSTDVPMKPFKVEGSGDPNQRFFDIEMPSSRVVEIKLVDGVSQKAVYTPDNIKKNNAELNTLLLRQVVQGIDGVPVRGNGPILDMSLKERDFLLRWLVDNQPGPQYGDVKQDCPECVRSFPLVVTIREMFRG